MIAHGPGDAPDDPDVAPVIPLNPQDGEDSGASGEDRLSAVLSFLRRRLNGEYEVDEFGFDRELTDKVLLPLVRALYQYWFRTELRGLENVPESGCALLVGNHSGTLPIDGLMLQVAVHDHAHRDLRLLGADLVYQVPVLGHLSRKAGHTLAHPADAHRLLAKGELVGVFPEGFKGVGKPFRERYRLQRFGRGGFVETALRARAPIIPVAIVGAEEIYPKIGDVRALARLLGLPYFPITPTFPLLGALGLVPLPSKWLIRFGEPMFLEGYGPEDADDPMTVFDLTDHVRETIQQMLYDTLLERGPAF
ncbi:lysophospholipid acyltransferase family protein [Thermomonospora cellulosilytica]|uniref:1-acyl-sn-glycerol-3-phosphate acyltransferase n=1 Tax=Thermomonospora cellulosilytica TaxID=1411118 RepID=A0A7W3MT64_9ACTN|nr:lysophospholipid acyltransferase family protein [Thermomonospora cellulosilytica]MBA9001446.1 1-acyl-sn-glycerol-3-phosphate acyltransferase [Thermomonospora cellulosilytica]